MLSLRTYLIALGFFLPILATAAPLPNHVQITYHVYATRSKIKVGKAVVDFKQQAGKYTLSSDARATGMVSLFSGKRARNVSSGLVDATGLKPVQLATYTEKSSTPKHQAYFDWAANRLSYGGQETKTAPLQVGAQDVATFAFQLMHRLPLLQPLPIQVTTGKKVEVYTFRTLGEETIDLPFADDVRVVHLQSHPQASGEQTDAWFAPAYGWLPVKLKQITSDGDRIEQQASKIQLNGQVIAED